MATRKSGRNLIVWLLSFLLVIAAGIAALAWRAARIENLTPAHSVKIALPLFQSSALLLLAQEKRFFALEGIRAEFQFFPTGRICLDQMLAGKADYAVVYETPVVHATLAGRRLQVLSEIYRGDGSTAVVTRRDLGIRSAEDLRGRKVGVVPKTNAEFLLGLYLNSNMMRHEDVKTIPLKAEEILVALQRGQVDAAALWEPYLSQATSQPGEFVLLKSPYYSEFSLLVAPPGGESDSLQSAQRRALLAALEKALAYYDLNQPRAEGEVDEILRRHGVQASRKAWQSMDIHLGLSATLLAMLNEEASFVRSLSEDVPRIDLSQILSSRYLAEMAPQLVTFE